MTAVGQPSERPGAAGRPSGRPPERPGPAGRPSGQVPGPAGRPSGQVPGPAGQVPGPAGQVPGPAGTQEPAISQDPGRSWKKALKRRFSWNSRFSSFFAFWRNFEKSGVWGGQRDPWNWALPARPGVLYRPLITAKHFPNDRPNRGPIFRFRCTNPHETVIFYLFFWKNRFSRKRKMDHFVGKCTFGGVFRCTISLGNAQNVHQFPGNSRVDGSTPPQPQILLRFFEKSRDFSIFHGFARFPYKVRENGPPAAKLEKRLFFLVLAPKSDPRRVVAPPGFGPPQLLQGPAQTWTKGSVWPPPTWDLLASISRRELATHLLWTYESPWLLVASSDESEDAKESRLLRHD